MDQFDVPQDKEYEELNDAILKAIVSSSEVKKLLLDFKKKELINDTAVLNLILSLDELCEMIAAKAPSSASYKAEPPARKQSEKNTAGQTQAQKIRTHFIDGKDLSENEIRFEEFCQQEFNQQEWLRKAKIIL